MKIDWESFPEAMHYMPVNEGYYSFFAYKDHDTWMIKFDKPEHWQPTEWIVSRVNDSLLTMMIERPKQEEDAMNKMVVIFDSNFDYDELEPWIGEEVIVHHAFVNNFGYEVSAIEKSDGECTCIVSELLAPLKSEEEQERKEAIDQIASLIGFGTFYEDAERIYEWMKEREENDEVR